MYVVVILAILAIAGAFKPMGPNTAAGAGAAAAGAVSIVDKGASTDTESPTAAVDSSVAGQRSTLFTLTDSPSALGEVEETSTDSELLS